MRIFRVDSFEKFHECLQRHDQQFTVYRGVSHVDHPLIPKIGRPQTKLNAPLHKAEKKLFQMFQERAVPHLDFMPRNEWEWLAIMQHHGLPTRLLDWSRNPLVAAYFAVEKARETDSAVYAWRSKDRPIDINDKPGPFNPDGEPRKFIPAYVTDRIIAQTGIFTVHPSPQTEMTSDTLEKMVIAQSFRKSLKDILFKYGIHRATLFPGLDGLADHLTWLHVESH